MRLTVCPLAWESHGRKGRTIGWRTRMLMLAFRIALAWTLMSLLLTAFWLLLLELGGGLGRGRASTTPAPEPRPLSAEVRAVYGDFVDEDGVPTEVFTHGQANETAESDIIVLVWGAVPTRER
jgi:hypothetical protein